MFSLIIEFNKKNIKNASKFLNSITMSAPKLVNQEIIFLIADNAREVLKLIDNFALNNKNLKFKIIYSTKALSLNQQIYFILQQVSKQYLWFLDPLSKFENDNKIESVLKVLDSDQPDIVEIKPVFNGITKWTPQYRLWLDPLKKYDLNNNPKIIAYTFPFLLNKILNRKVLDDIFKLKLMSNLKNDSSSNLSSEILYLALLNAKTYLWIKDETIFINLNEANVPSYNYVLNEWRRILAAYEKKNIYLDEIEYARAYYLLVVLTGLYGNKKMHLIFKDPQLICKNYYEKLTKLGQNKMQKFVSKNPYMQADNPEINLLKSIQPVGKWNKIFGKLE